MDWRYNNWCKCVVYYDFNIFFVSYVCGENDIEDVK